MPAGGVEQSAQNAIAKSYFFPYNEAAMQMVQQETCDRDRLSRSAHWDQTPKWAHFSLLPSQPIYYPPPIFWGIVIYENVKNLF